MGGESRANPLPWIEVAKHRGGGSWVLLSVVLNSTALQGEQGL